MKLKFVSYILSKGKISIKKKNVSKTVILPFVKFSMSMPDSDNGASYGIYIS